MLSPTIGSSMSPARCKSISAFPGTIASMVVMSLSAAKASGVRASSRGCLANERDHLPSREIFLVPSFEPSGSPSASTPQQAWLTRAANIAAAQNKTFFIILTHKY